MRSAISKQRGQFTVADVKTGMPNKMVKGTKLKVQAAIQGDQLRVSGKNKDDLQKIMELLRGTDLDIHMEFTNYR